MKWKQMKIKAWLQTLNIFLKKKELNLVGY